MMVSLVVVLGMALWLWLSPQSWLRPAGHKNDEPAKVETTFKGPVGPPHVNGPGDTPLPQ
jgi:hypothetical protein